jgi:pimeloyl-ACP methyl ester carboxylesterase
LVSLIDVLNPWQEANPPSGRESTQRSNAERRIEAALDSRLIRRWPFEPNARADLRLSAGSEASWMVRARGRRVFVTRGTKGRADGSVTAPPDTLAEILEGQRSGVEAWLEGKLTVRGNIALAMKLEGLLRNDGRPARFPKPAFVHAHGIDTFYLDAGEGPIVLLLHGLGASNASMLPTLYDLARDHRVIALDLPGFGESSKPIRAYHAGFFAKWLVAVLDALGIERAHLIGNSMGGRIAIETALRFPARVDRMGLIAPAVAFRKLRQFVPIVRVLRPELGAVPLPLPRMTVTRSIERLFARKSRIRDAWFQAAADEFLRVFATARGRVAFFSAAREIYLDEPFGERGFWDRLVKLQRPALFLWGDSDVMVPHGFARHVERAVPNARSVVLSDCGHVPQFENPALIHRLLRDFLASR